MNESIIWAVLGLLVGAAISWVLSRSRQRQALAEAAAAALEVSTQLQVELSSLKERASRIPELEGLLATSVQALNAANERKAALAIDIIDALHYLHFYALRRAAGPLDQCRRGTGSGERHVSLP
jgi:hypothetical protein